MKDLKLSEVTEILEDNKQVYRTKEGKKVIVVPLEEYEELVHNKGYKDFYEQIDWVRLGKFLEDTKNYDDTGWENLGRAWRHNDECGVVAYLYRAFNKDFTYSELLESENVAKLPMRQQDILHLLTNLSYIKYKEKV